MKEAQPKLADEKQNYWINLSLPLSPAFLSLSLYLYTE